MTINSNRPWNQQQGDGSKTKFTFTFDVEIASDLTVYVTPFGQTPDPDSDIISSSAYTVLGIGYGNTDEHSVTFTTAPANNSTVTIMRIKPFDRLTNFSLSGEFSAADLNNQFDDLVAMIQQIDNKLQKLGLYYVNNQILLDNNTQNILPKLPANTGSGIPVWTTNSNSALVAGSITEDSGCSTLRSELVSNTNGADGASIVGYYNSVTPANNTVKEALDELYAAPEDPDLVVGSMIPTFSTQVPTGWILYDDGYMGPSASSGSMPSDGTPKHADDDFEDLYKIFWNNCTDFVAPVAGGRGVSANDDWNNNKYLRMPLLAGRAIGLIGQSIPLITFTASSGTGAKVKLTVTSTSDFYTGLKVRFTSTGTLPTNLSLGTDYYVTVSSSTELYISTSLANVISGTLIGYASSGTGVHTIIPQFTSRALGDRVGEENHLLLASELPDHTHTTTACKSPSAPSSDAIASGDGNFNTSTTTTTSSVGNSYHNNLGPTSFIRWIIRYLA